MEQWGIAREMRERVKARFDHEGIDLAVAQRVMWQESAPVGGLRRAHRGAAADGPRSGPTGAMVT